MGCPLVSVLSYNEPDTLGRHCELLGGLNQVP